MEKITPITNSVQTTGQRLKLLRRITGLSRQQLGELIDYSATNIQYWEEDQSPISAKGCNRLLPVFHEFGLQCNKTWLLEGIGMWPQFNNAISQTGDEPHDDALSNEEKYILEEIQLFYRLPNSITLNVLDAGMSPIYCPGDTLGGIKLDDSNDFTTFIGHDCIIQTAQGQQLCRTLQESKSPNIYNLIPHNISSDTPPIFDQSLQFIAPVMRVWRRS